MMHDCVMLCCSGKGTNSLTGDPGVFLWFSSVGFALPSFYMLRWIHLVQLCHSHWF